MHEESKPAPEAPATPEAKKPAPTAVALNNTKGTLQIDFDVLHDTLLVRNSDGDTAEVPLAPQPVATFYRRVMDTLDAFGMPVRIYPVPNEIPDATPFAVKMPGWT